MAGSCEEMVEMKSTVMTTRARRSFRYRPALEMSPCGRWLLTWSDHGARAFVVPPVCQATCSSV
jgi:hypothetical protein